MGWFEKEHIPSTQNPKTILSEVDQFLPCLVLLLEKYSNLYKMDQRSQKSLNKKK